MLVTNTSNEYICRKTHVLCRNSGSSAAPTPLTLRTYHHGHKLSRVVPRLNGSYLVADTVHDPCVCCECEPRAFFLNDISVLTMAGRAA